MLNHPLKILKVLLHRDHMTDPCQTVSGNDDLEWRVGKAVQVMAEEPKIPVRVVLVRWGVLVNKLTRQKPPLRIKQYLPFKSVKPVLWGRESGEPFITNDCAPLTCKAQVSGVIVAVG